MRQLKITNKITNRESVSLEKYLNDIAKLSMLTPEPVSYTHLDVYKRQASVCVSSMALMDAGVKITAPISGVAMGLIKEGDKAAILTDILGDEDALGDMDFKVTGTEKGICGCQMDMKIEGLSYELLEKALAQAKEGRIHILNEMAKTISEAREDYKPHAPRIVEIRIPKSLIGAVIGPGAVSYTHLDVYKRQV